MAINEWIGGVLKIPDFLINLLQIIGVAALVYLIYLAIKAFFRMKAIKDVRTAKENIIQINHKLNRIIELLEKKYGKRPKEK